MTRTRNPVKLDRAARTTVLVCRDCGWREVVTRVTASAAEGAAARHVVECWARRDPE